jgi:NADH:ubiquinone oxidoreductase subunit 5 (subunit L)/multisubunit Na+/H+ antiporter MnhA subunit
MPFSFLVTAPNHRINSTVMLILSSINFKIAVTTRLPTVSYLTVLDKYSLTALIYLGVLCSYHSIIGGSLINHPDQYDWIFFIAFAVIYAIFHFFYILYFLKKYFNHKKLKNDYELKVAELKDLQKKRVSIIALSKSAFD